MRNNKFTGCVYNLTRGRLQDVSKQSVIAWRLWHLPAKRSCCAGSKFACGVDQGYAPMTAIHFNGEGGLGMLDAAALRGFPPGPGLMLGGAQGRADLNGWGYANLWAPATGSPPVLGNGLPNGLAGMPGMMPGGGLHGGGMHGGLGLPGGGMQHGALPQGLGLPMANGGQHGGFGMLPLLDGMNGMALSPPPPPPPAAPGMRGHYITTSPDSKRPQATEINQNKAITKRLASAVHYQQARGEALHT